MTKKILTILIILLLVAAALAYYFFFLSFESGLPADGAEERTGFARFFPFGGESGESVRTPTAGENAPGDGISRTDDGKPLPALRQISDKPTAGAVAFTPADRGASTTIRFADRATGHIFEANTLNGEIKRISNTTIPKLAEALWNPSGTRVVMRYLSADGRTIETFSALVEPGDESEGKTTGDFLFKNLSSVAWSPDGKKIAWLSDDGGGARLATSNPDGGGIKEIFRSDFGEWLLDWPVAGEIILNTKPSSGVEGFAYSLNPSSGRLSRVLGNIEGLATLVSKDGKKVLYLESKGGAPELGALDRAAGTRETLAGTMPEKCVWSAKEKSVAYCGIPFGLGGGEYPDGWYKGTVSTDDAIWKIDTDGNFAELVSAPDGVDGGADVWKPFMDPEESHLFFINKKDQSFWSLKLE